MIILSLLSHLYLCHLGWRFLRHWRLDGFLDLPDLLSALGLLFFKCFELLFFLEISHQFDFLFLLLLFLQILQIFFVFLKRPASVNLC